MTKPKPIQLAVDVGGTFTDLLAMDASGQVTVFKVPTQVKDPSEGVLNALAGLAQQWGIDVEEVMGRCTRFVHGSTIATNTILEHKGAKVGLVTTRGFRDSLEIRRGYRVDQWNHRSAFPPVLVPRHLRLPVGGRIDRRGDEIEAFVESDVASACDIFQSEGVESIAVCLINSFLTDDHERQCAALLARQRADWPISLSADIAPIIGEYERSSTTVINAYIAPRVVSYLSALNETLKARGLEHPMLLLQSNGGIISVDELAERAVSLVLSGPAAAVGALDLYSNDIQTQNLISMEIGGTSCDVLLMDDGDIAIHDHLLIGGYDVAIPSVDIHTVGAGGGTIARVDEAGLLEVGPEGAGADPGPACYGRGGEFATVTDAQLVLGRLRAGDYAGGSVRLNLDNARDAIAREVAGPLDISIENAAVGIVRLVEQHLIHAVEQISVERGHNPESFTLVASGGAGPMHGGFVAHALGCTRVYIPRHAGVFCAVGMLNSDIRRDYFRVYFNWLHELQRDRIAQIFSQLEERARDDLIGEGIDTNANDLRTQLDLRYKAQQWSITVDVERTLDEAQIRQRFEGEHRRLFGHIQPDGSIEITGLRLIATGRLELVQEAAAAETNAKGTADHPLQRGSRSVYWDESVGWCDTPIYTGGELGPRFECRGPAIIEELTSTIVLPPGDLLCVDERRNYLIEVNRGE